MQNGKVSAQDSLGTELMEAVQNTWAHHNSAMKNIHSEGYEQGILKGRVGWLY